MSAREVDAYLRKLGEPHRSTLQALRETILDIMPEAEQGMSYGVPVFKLEGKNIAGFSAAKAHLSYLPHSGNVTSVIQDNLSDYVTSKGVLKFSPGTPLPRNIVKLLIDARRAEV